LTPALADARSAVLHLSAATGGGVERYIRDLAASVPGCHYCWHIGSGLDAIEEVAAHRFLPLADHSNETYANDVLARWLRAAGIGIVHLHGVDEACRNRLALIEHAAAIPWIVTLHDVTFVNPRAFEMPGPPVPDSAWLAEVSTALRQAAAIVVPSEFVRGIALAHLPGLDFELVAPGLDAARAAVEQAAPPAFAALRPAHVVAVVGAIGPHKGSALLDALVARLEGTDIGLAVIGYTDTQITPGWRVPGRYYVHGPYLDTELAGLLAAYRVDVALFPNRMPESFSYTLSEVWAAGIPVAVPDEGALGERVAKQGGGWRLPPGYTAAGAAEFLQGLFSPERAAERARVESQIDPHDDSRIPSLAAMSREIDALYQRFGLPQSAAGSDAAAARDALEPLLAANLDGFAFRKELIKLAGEVVELRAAAAALFEENRRLADDKAAFDQLPLLVRKLLLKKAFRARR
jgi:glycosyltransferase involved in cell wall biosynthesis